MHHFNVLKFLSCLLAAHCFITIGSVSIANTDENLPTIGVYQKNFAGKIVKVITETGNSDATLPALDVTDHIWEGKSIQLDCNANYPVQWTYSAPASPAVHVQTYRQAPDFANPETYQFSSSVTFTHTDRKQTGNYSCQSIEKPNLQTSVYLFVPGKSRLFLDGPTKDANNVTTLIWSSEINGTHSPWIVFPCAISIKDTAITLYRNESSDPVKVGVSTEKSDDLTYDPKVGFSYKWNEKKEEGPWGVYYCQGEFKNMLKKMPFHLTKPDSTDMHNFTGKLTMNYNEKKKRIECCISGCDRDIRPTMIQSRCESVSDCAIRHKFVQDKPCSKKCLEHFHDIATENCSAYDLGNYTDSGLIQCSWPKNETANGVTSSDIIDSTKYFQFSYTNGNFISEFDKMPALDTILEIFREPLENSTKVAFSCHANHFFFSLGLKWALKSKSGSIDFIDEENFPAKHQISLSEDENDYIICYAPVWNSATEWRNVSYTFSKP